MVLVLPVRGVEIGLTPWLAVALVGVELGTGVLPRLLGVGGGVIVGFALIVGFGFPDLLAKGTSLLLMIPTAGRGVSVHGSGRVVLAIDLPLLCSTHPAPLTGCA